jgi:GTP cyclohydrolase III
MDGFTQNYQAHDWSVVSFFGGHNIMAKKGKTEDEEKKVAVVEEKKDKKGKSGEGKTKRSRPKRTDVDSDEEALTYRVR